jgi:hypothetical protein
MGSWIWERLWLMGWERCRRTWNSRVFLGANFEEARIRKVSKMVTLPVPLSSAPGDLPVDVLPTES